jgi:hypothetical protein
LLDVPDRRLHDGNLVMGGKHKEFRRKDAFHLIHFVLIMPS